MNDESQDFDLSQKQKSRLLSLGLGSKPHKSSTEEIEQKMDMLYDVLTHTLPTDPSVVNSLPAVVRDLSSGLQSLAGNPIGDLVQDPTTDIATISRIKQYAKDMGTSADSEGKYDVFLVVYYAAIASALLFKHEKITQHSHKDLERFFLSFMKEDWVLDEIKDLLRKAHTHCERIVGRSDGPLE